MYILAVNLFGSLADIMSRAYGPALAISGMIGTLMALFVIQDKPYKVLGLFVTRKFKRAEHNHKYAILIPARNEETVIGNLINSIKKQDYPQDLITISVVADNCTDNTAQIAREKGAICYEHHNPDERTKGFALKYLFEQIQRDYGITSFEGYFIFDSDNLLKKDYISRMNDSFDAGEKIITSYRATKNFSENWIASTYALHWLRSIRTRHRARSFLHLATNIQGTGFLFASEIVKDGWKYTSLTEDRALTADWYNYTWRTIRHRFMSFDTFAQLLPKNIINIFRWIIVYLILYPFFCSQFGLDNIRILYNSTWLAHVITHIFGDITVSLPAGAETYVLTILIEIWVRIYYRIGLYFFKTLEAVYLFIIENKRMPKISIWKKILYCFTWPTFDIIGRYTQYVALFKKVEWKPIPHKSEITIDDISQD